MHNSWTINLVALFCGLICFFWVNPLTRMAKRLSHRLGALDYSRTAEQGGPAPRLGGAVFLALFLFWFALALLMQPYLSHAHPSVTQKVLFFVLGGIAVWVVGLFDDIYGLRARWKLMAEVAIAILVVLGGIRVDIIVNPLSPANPLHLGALSIPLNIIWIVVAINAMNIVDGIDGLAVGLFSITMVLMLATSLVLDNFIVILFASCMLGGALSFLRYYKPSDSIFLGDCGSLLLGYMLAGLGSLATLKSTNLAAAIIPLAIISLPLAETFISVLRRLLKGQPIAAGDRKHLHHVLLRRGMSPKGVVRAFQAMALVMATLALLTVRVDSPLVSLMLMTASLLLLAAFFGLGYLGFKPSLNLRRMPLVLDESRLLQKRIWHLRNCRDLDQAWNELLPLAQMMDLAGVSLEIKRGIDHRTWTWGVTKKGDEENAPVMVSLEPEPRGGIHSTALFFFNGIDLPGPWGRTMAQLNAVADAFAEIAQRSSIKGPRIVRTKKAINQ